MFPPALQADINLYQAKQDRGLNGVRMTQLIFIPGLLCTEALFASQITAFEGLYDIQIAPTTSRSSITDMAEAARELITDRAVIIGLSMGGYVALELALRYPEAVAGLGLLSTSARADDDERRKMREELIRLSSIGRFKGVTPRLLPRFLSPEALANDIITSTVMSMAETIGQENFVLQQRAIIARQDQRPNLSALSMPSLVLCGLQDELTPPHLSEEMADKLGNAELVLIERCGHLSTLEAADTVNSALQRLIERAV